MCVSKQKSIDAKSVTAYKVLAKLKDGSYVAPARILIKRNEVYTYTTGANTTTSKHPLHTYTDLDAVKVGLEVIGVGLTTFRPDLGAKLVVVECTISGNIRQGDHLHIENGAYVSDTITIDVFNEIEVEYETIDMRTAMMRIFN